MPVLDSLGREAGLQEALDSLRCDAEVPRRFALSGRRQGVLSLEQLWFAVREVHERPLHTVKGIVGLAPKAAVSDEAVVIRHHVRDALRAVRQLTEMLALQTAETARLTALEHKVQVLSSRVTALEEQRAVEVEVTTLAPEPYELLRPFRAVIRWEDDQYVASFVEADTHASGDTRAEALDNLKDMVIGTYNVLRELSGTDLGPLPERQLAVLEEFIREKP